MKKLLLALLIIATSTFAAIGMRASVRGEIGYDQIVTAGSKSYPHGTIQGRSWFVELVDCK